MVQIPYLDRIIDFTTSYISDRQAMVWIRINRHRKIKMKGLSLTSFRLKALSKVIKMTDRTAKRLICSDKFFFENSSRLKLKKAQ